MSRQHRIAPLSGKDAADCAVVFHVQIPESDEACWGQPVIREWVHQRVFLQHGQIVAQLKLKKEPKKAANADTSVITDLETVLTQLDLRKKSLKVLAVTPGALIVGPTKRGGIKALLALSGTRVVLPWQTLQQIQGVAIDPTNASEQLVAIWGQEFSNSDDTGSHIKKDATGMPASWPKLMYQSPQSQLPLMESLARAHLGVPPWAVPCRVKGFLGSNNNKKTPLLKELPSCDTDGGLSYRFQANVWARLLAQELLPENNKQSDLGSLPIRQYIIDLLRAQQPADHPFCDQLYQTLNTRELVQQLITKLEPPNDKGRAAQRSLQHWRKHKAELQRQLELDLVDCLAFNLVVRTLQLHRLSDTTAAAAQTKKKSAAAPPPVVVASPSISVARLLLYNVTLRHLDLSHSRHLDGQMLGDALSRNAQPLLSTLILDDCDLTTMDVGDGWSRGLARVWGAGGTAHPICLSVANNPKVDAGGGWDALWRAILMQRDNVPPAELRFWQKLNVKGTTAATSPVFATLIGRLTGLLHLEWDFDPNAADQDPGKLVPALAASPAPLKKIVAKGLKTIHTAAHRHANTLQLLDLEDWSGDAESIVNGWPQPVPKLSVNLHGYLSRATCSPNFNGHCPGRLCISQKGPVTEQVLLALARDASGLETLELEQVAYTLLVTTGAIATLAMGGNLKKLVFKNPAADLVSNMTRAAKIEFWTTLAESKTIEYLDVRGQLQTGDLQLVGQFLKKNRSLRVLYYDSPHLVLDVEEVKVLRSAFYGNKKVVFMPYPEEAHKRTMDTVRQQTQECNNNILGAKKDIKRIFQSHYSKYNPRWRDTPNQLKLPFVEKIRVNKRKIGKMNRDSAKKGQLFDMIRRSVTQNQSDYHQQKEEKAVARLQKRTPQLQKLAAKRGKVLRTLVTKLHRAKQKAAKKKSAKEQVPRSTYYRRRGAWPFKGQGSRPSSHYHRYNDPYRSRYYGNDPYYHYYYGNHYYYDDDSRDETDVPEESDLLPPVSEYICPDTTATIDSLESNLDSGMTSPSFMEELHLQLSEHGEDTITELSPAMDTLSALPETTGNIAESVGATPEEVSAFMSSVDNDPFSMSELQSTLPDIEDSAAVDDGFDDDNDFAEQADEAVNMYAGAGPRDLDDGGGPSRRRRIDPVVAGARRRARTRKINRDAVRSRERAAAHRPQGYQSLDLVSTQESREDIQQEEEDECQSVNLKSRWTNEATSVQIEAIRESGLQGVPDIAEFEPVELYSWKATGDKEKEDSMEVCLVTQCSLDRLDNLCAQLGSWKGKSSVALYLKKGESSQLAKDRLESMFDGLTSGTRANTAITLVEGLSDAESYPINYLRNIALLQARSQLQSSDSTNYFNSAVFLVDVDFVPSQNLRETLIHPRARDAILDDRRVVVVPAFEDRNSTGNHLPGTCQELQKQVKHGIAEPFHITNFEQGHGPTNFDKYWSLSDSSTSPSEVWSNSYDVQYEKLFEPYVVMATDDVPLYDERFQGYGLNKVSHLASVAHTLRQDLLVLPGVFVVAPSHERSEAYKSIYGNSSCSSSGETDFAKLHLKGLYQDFLLGDCHPVVSQKTNVWHQKLSLVVTVVETNDAEGRAVGPLIY